MVIRHNLLIECRGSCRDSQSNLEEVK